MAKVRYVVFDFDGTCTQVETIHARFLHEYGTAIGATRIMIGNATAWDAALAAVRAASPEAGWTIANAPGTAPAAADPYILAFEAAQWLLRQQALRAVPDVYANLYRANEPPLRPELGKLLADLDAGKLKLGFISNSARDAVAARVQEACRPYAGLFDRMRVTGDAAKFTVNEHAFDQRGPHHARFAALPATLALPVGRPIYLRRGKYFDALCRFYREHGESPTVFPIDETLIVGDVWELDLAMPAALGAHVHLIERAEPFPTYDYEHAQVKYKSRDLTGVLDTIAACA